MAQEKILSRREKEKLRKRQYILTAALELFSQNGYHRVSMNEIAEKAEFAVGTLYKFFKNKRDIYQSILTESADKSHLALDKSLEQGSDEIEKLRNYVRVKTMIFRESAPAIRLYLSETDGISFNLKAGLDAAIRNKFEEVRQKLAVVFESGIRKKTFDKVGEPYHLAVALEGMLHGFLFTWFDEPEKHPFPDDPDAILDILLKGCLTRNEQNS